MPAPVGTLAAVLFVDRTAGPPTGRQVITGALAVLSATVLSLGRTRGHGAWDTIWAEDGRNFLADALNLSVVDAVTAPFNGYWHLVPRLLAEVASGVPIEWAPAVLSAGAALVTSTLALIVYVASGPYLRHPALRLLAAVPAALPAVGVGWVENNVATLQFPMLYALFWVLLWMPGTRWGRLVAVLAVPLIAFSTALAVIFVPLAVARLVLRRGWLALALTAGLVAGAALQFGGLALGWTTRAGIGAPRYDPVWAVGDYLTKLVPTAVFGEKWAFDRMLQGVCPDFVVIYTREHQLLVLTSWLVFAGLVVMGARLGRPAWTLAAVAAAHSVALYAATIMTLGCAVNRYFVAPALLLYTVAAALLRPPPAGEDDAAAPAGPDVAAAPAGPDVAAAPAGPGVAAGRNGPGRLPTPTVVVLTLAAAVCLVGLRTDGPRAHSPSWSHLVRTARQQCADDRTETVAIMTNIPNWTMHVNCAALE
jgi:hypothetical protein